MKKRMISLCLLLCMVIVSGCDGENDGQANEQTIDSTEMNQATETQMTGTEMSETEDAEFPEETSAVGRITYVGESYDWQDVRITIPQAWKDKYVVKEDANGVSFYQAASNEKEESMGFLCGIYRSDQYSNSGTGET